MAAVLILLGGALFVLGLSGTLGLSGIAAIQSTVILVGGCVLVGAGAIVDAVTDVRRTIAKAAMLSEK